MKKYISIIILTLLPLLANAQGAVIRQDNRTSVSTTIITKETKLKEKKVFAKYDANIGYQQMVEVGTKLMFEPNYVGASYIGGWRFNNWLYAGVGVGLDVVIPFDGWCDMAHKSFLPYLKDRYVDKTFSSVSDGYIDRFSLPVFFNIRSYFMRTALAPYMSTSIGCRLSHVPTFYYDISLGADYRLNKDCHMYLAIGCVISALPKMNN